MTETGDVLGELMGAPKGTVAMHQNVATLLSIVGSALDFNGTKKKVVYTAEQALKIANALSVERRDELVTRLDSVRVISRNIGYGVEDDMDFLMSKFTPKRQ